MSTFLHAAPLRASCPARTRSFLGVSGQPSGDVRSVVRSTGGPALAEVPILARCPAAPTSAQPPTAPCLLRPFCASSSWCPPSAPTASLRNTPVFSNIRSYQTPQPPKHPKLLVEVHTVRLTAPRVATGGSFTNCRLPWCKTPIPAASARPTPGRGHRRSSAARPGPARALPATR
jgi:hypothetical protein